MRGLTPNARRLAREQVRDKPPQGVTYSWVEPGVVATVTAGAASDGNALAAVTYRGVTQELAYLSSYTPVVGHTVAVSVSSSGAAFVLGRLIGTP